MPRYLIKMEKDGEQRYLEWSTIVDAPVTYGMTYDELLEYYRDEYGAHSMDDLVGERGRMSRVMEKGTSEHMAESVEQTIFPNRAGDDESELTYDEIWEKYVAGRPADGDEDDEDEDEDEDEDVLSDFQRLCAMLTRAGVGFRENFKQGKRIIEVPVGSTTARFFCDADGLLVGVDTGEPQNSL